MVQSVVQSAIRNALDEELRRAKEDLRKARTSQEVQFQSQVKKVAEEAAHAAASSEVERLHKLIEAVVATEVRKEAERAVPLAVRDDPLMKRILAENLEKMRAEIRSAAAKELHEICNEDRYHRVNRAFLSALDERCEKAVRETEDRANEAVKRSCGPQRFTQGIAFLAFVMAGVALLVPKTK